MDTKIIIVLVIGLIIGAGLALAGTMLIEAQQKAMLPLEQFLEMDKEQLIKYKDKTNAELKLIECLESPAFVAFISPELLPPGLPINPCLDEYDVYERTR